MNHIDNISIPFAEYIENTALNTLTDEQYSEFQGYYLEDKIRFLSKNGSNVLPVARLNGFPNI
jgi:hypothetical protein